MTYNYKIIWFCLERTLRTKETLEGLESLSPRGQKQHTLAYGDTIYKTSDSRLLYLSKTISLVRRIIRQQCQPLILLSCSIRLPIHRFALHPPIIMSSTHIIGSNFTQAMQIPRLILEIIRILLCQLNLFFQWRNIQRPAI